MKDEGYIRKAVELAPERAPWDFYKFNPECVKDIGVVELDALAAQLVRQVDADALAAQLVRQVDDTEYHVEVHRGFTAVRVDECFGDNDWRMRDVAAKYGPDRTMNTIKAVVDSGVLDE